MVVAAVSVDVSVIEFLGSGVAHSNYGDIKMQREASQGMVGIQGDVVAIDLSNGDDAVTVVVLGVELQPYLDIGARLEGKRDGRRAVAQWCDHSGGSECAYWV